MSLPRTMRVGYVLKRYPRYSETFIVNEILAHEAAGLQVEIFSLRPPEETVLHDTNGRVRAPIHYLPHGLLKVRDWWRALRVAGSLLPGSKPLLEADDEEVSLTDLYQALVLAGEARRGGLHHLHAHFASSATTVARLAAGFTGLNYTFTAHANDIFNQNVQSENLRRKLEEAAAVVTVSDYNIAYLRETFGAAAARVRRIYNGLDLDRFRYAPPADCPPRIVSVGRLVEKKGFDVLIDACAILARRGTRFTCRIIGDGELEAELRARVEQLGLGAQVELAGALPQTEVMELVRGAAVLAAPCVVGRDGNRDGLPRCCWRLWPWGRPACPPTSPAFRRWSATAKPG